MLGYTPDDRETYVEWHNHRYPRSALVPLPCGQCIGCRIDYSRQWANRCLLELKYHDSAWFCTFTYDDDHVPRTYYPDPETGEAIPALTLQKRDFQLLMKRIRKKFENDKIRFFMSGEYGSQTFRPHYHAILFGLHLDDLLWSSIFVTLVAKKMIQLCSHSSFVRCSVAIEAMWTHIIVIDVCKFFDSLIKRIFCFEFKQVGTLVFEGVEIALHWGIVVWISGFAHALRHMN